MRRLLFVLFLSATCIAQTNSTPAILTNNEGERYDLKFGTAVMKVTSVQTGGTWSMVDFTASPGAQTMLHRHPKTDETFFVLEGDLTMYVDGKLSTLHHGDMAYVPKMTVPNENSISEKNR
jgi:quercetin dioxygenase-like cupin family protein